MTESVISQQTALEVQGERAASDLRDISALRNTLPFTRYFMREAQEKLHALERRLRERNLDERERQFVLGQIDVYERWRDKLDADEASNANILRQSSPKGQ